LLCWCYRKRPHDAANVWGHGQPTKEVDLKDCTLSTALPGKPCEYLPPSVCVLRDCGMCALSDATCAAPCSLRGFALAIWMAGYHHTRSKEQVLARLCNPREYASDEEYRPYLEFLGVVG